MTDLEKRQRAIALLKKAVEFSQAEFGELRQGDILNLKEDLWELTNYPEEEKGDFLKRLSPEKLTSIQDQFKDFFTRLADGDTAIAFDTEGDPITFLANAGDSRSARFTYSINTNDPFVLIPLTLITLLIASEATPEQFRKCPECKKLFFLGRKPDERNFYCSQRCAVRVAVRNSRKDKAKSKTKTKRRVGK